MTQQKHLFPAKFAILKIKDGVKQNIKLESTLSSTFLGKNNYMVDNSIISNYRVCFATAAGAKVFKSKVEDTFSVNGVWYDSSKS